MMVGNTLSVEAVQTGRRLADFVMLTKPRVVTMVLLTTLVGYHLGAHADAAPAPLRLILTLLGTALAAAGTLALNQYLERDTDAQMARTCGRPLPDGRMAPLDALVFGAALTAGGLLLLTFMVGTLPALITAVITVTYLFAYTPLKSRTSFCSVVGAVPGALPPLTGWAAASGDLGLGAWIVFGIMFLWQIPHSLAIAQLYRDDYARAGIRLLPVVEPDGGSTGRQMVHNSLALLTVALLPTLVGLAGAVYFATALVLGLGLLVTAVRAARSHQAADARRLLAATLIYLPVVLGTLALDKLPVGPWS